MIKTLIKRSHLFAGAAFALSAVTVSAQFTLTLLHNNDGESQLIDAGDGLENYGGIHRFVAVVENTRTEYQNMGHGVLTLSSGDNFLAGPEFNASIATLETETPVFYDALGLEAIDYDAIIIGNHDFDFGPNILAQFVDQVDNAIYLSANLDFSGEQALQDLVDGGEIAASTLIEVDADGTTVRVGIVGATTPQLPFISSPGGVVVNADVASVVQAEIDDLRNNQNADVVIFVSHLQAVGEDEELIGMLTGIDAAIAGGGDELLANDGDLLLPGDEISDDYPIVVKDADENDVPVVTTAGSYKYLGRLTLEFDSDGDLENWGGGPIRVVDTASGEADGVVPDADVKADVVDPVVAYIEGLATTVIGTTDYPLDGRRNSIRSKETNLGNLVADAMLWSAVQSAEDFGIDEPDICITGGGGIRNDSIINAGGEVGHELTALDTFDILPFSNFVSVVPDVLPEDLFLLMENLVSQVSIEDGAIAPTGPGTGRFGQIAGFTIHYDPTAQAMVLDEETNEITTAGERLISISLNDGTVIAENGEVVDGAPSVDIVVTNFHAGGGDQYFGAYLSQAYEEDYYTLGATYQQALENYVTDGLGGDVSGDAYRDGLVRRIFADGYYSTVSVQRNVVGGTTTRTPYAMAYTPGLDITVTATPVNGYRFVGWEYRGALRVNNPYTFSLRRGANELMAVFERNVVSGESYWASLTGPYKNTADLTAPGVGWVYDEMFPWVYFWGMSGGAWVYIAQDISTGAEAFYGWNAAESFWFYADATWGSYYAFGQSAGWVDFE